MCQKPSFSAPPNSRLIPEQVYPGIPTRDEARIGLILSLEFGLLLLLKFANWTANGFRRFG